MLGLGACIVMDQAPFPHWPEPLQEGQNFLSLGLRITTDCQPAPEWDYAGIKTKMEAFLRNDAFLDSIRLNNNRYFDDFLFPIESGKALIAGVKQIL